MVKLPKAWPKKKKPPLPKKEKPSSSTTRKGFGIWLFLTLFISAWMFVLGIFVGRGTAPVQFDIEKLQKELATLKKEGLQKEQKRYKIEKDTVNEKTDLRFYEVLKDTRKDVALKTDTPIQKKEGLPDKTGSTQKDEGISEEILSPVSPLKEKSDFTGTKAEAAKNLTIQVASLKDADVADKMVAKLIKNGYPAYRTIGDVPGKGTWFRVRIGHFTNKGEAKSMLNRLENAGLKGILVLR